MQKSETLPQFLDLNLLPEELRARRYPIVFMLGILVLLAASLALIPLYQAQQSTRDETSRLQEELELISLDLALVQVDLGEIRGLQRQLEAAEADLASLNEERQAVLGGGRELSGDLAAVVLDMPPGVGLASVTGSDEVMTLSGQAPASGDVFEYVRMLRESGGFSEYRIVSLATESVDAVTFTIEAVR